MAKKSQIIRCQRGGKFPVQRYNRCNVCGRRRWYFRRFGLCRVCLRSLALQGMLPGVTKSSW